MNHKVRLGVKEFRKYPERIKEFVRWYPCDFGRINAHKIWNSKTGAMSKDNIALYIHLPFCKGKCTFCSFCVYTFEQNQAKRYLLALKKEIKLYAQQKYFKNHVIDSIWIGGGTPTTYSAKEIHSLLTLVLGILPYTDNVEITLETTPNDYQSDKLLFLSRTVTKLSVGIQSTDDYYLSMFNRLYTSRDIIEFVNHIKHIGYETVNADIIYAKPGETMEHWEKDITRLAGLGFDHISLFSFVAVEGTPIYESIKHGTLPPVCKRSTELNMYQSARQILKKEGYLPYTAYYFSKGSTPKFQYHIDRWKAPQKDVIGFGNGAFSYVYPYHYVNIHNIKQYMKSVHQHQLPIMVGKKLTPKEEWTREVILGMKFITLNLDDFASHFGFRLEEKEKKKLRRFQNLGLIKLTKHYMHLTTKGLFYINNLSKEFFTKNNLRKAQPLGLYLNEIKKI